MQGNILKISFLISYLAMLICIVSGIPFVTALFRSIILMAMFSLIGLVLRWWMLNMITGIETEEQPPESGTEEYAEPAEGGEAEYSMSDYDSNGEQSNNGQ